ncbi:hypothetical protein Rhopal_000070-T1 [Rhodotorula paludigena]|uniref:Transcription factor domain-containing protein n=1 Tax=Rhodotorula paludigena TaxID=86838 RepID=A0AAV5G4C5_9BASI|nr:hypothetical protein Rhopal_000070-T1 [Rhodotorula paludigena]
MQGPAAPPSAALAADGKSQPRKRAREAEEGRAATACQACRTGKRCVFITRLRSPSPPDETDEDNPRFRSINVPSPLPAAPEPPSEVADNLRQLNARLERIDSALSLATTPLNSFVFPSGEVETKPLEAPTSPAYLPNFFDPAGAEEAACSAMAVEDAASPVDSAAPDPVQAQWMRAEPDVIVRGFLSAQECINEFDFFFRNIQPWAGVLSTSLDSDALVVRARSPLLFHAILLLALYYRPHNHANITLYRSVSSILDAILAPQILCPQPDQLSFDFVRAMHLLLMYKPIQYASLNGQGVSDMAQIELASKMNVRASWLLRLLVSRVAVFIGLPSIAATFAQAVNNQHIAPIPVEMVSQQRLYLCCVFRELHGALQSGRTANFNSQAARQTARQFAALAQQPSDATLGASVELAALAAEAVGARTGSATLSAAELRRFDDGFDAWHAYWAPILAPAAGGTEPATPSWGLWHPYGSFTRLIVGGFTVDAAKQAVRVPALPGSDGGTATPSEGRRRLGQMLEVAQEMLLSISTRGGRLREGGRGLLDEWDDEGPLALDSKIAGKLKWASDSVTCVMFSYPLIVIAKLASASIVTSDLKLSSSEPAHSAPPTLSPSDKVCRLLDFGAHLLSALAPTPYHPSVKQAAYLRHVYFSLTAAHPSTDQVARKASVRAEDSPGFFDEWMDWLE